MSHFFLSDVHLRMDRPDRGERLAALVHGFSPEDRLTVVGDLCDFWMASRMRPERLLECQGLRELAEFRNRGGTLQVMAGNHDLWFCPVYEKVLGAEILAEPVELTAHGLRVHLVHGHLLGARKRWKSWMESREFHQAFGHVPGPLAGALDWVLEWKNQRSLHDDEERHLNIYRQYAAAQRGSCDLVVLGHVHRAVDEHGHSPRMIVLGGWQRRTSYLRIDDRGAQLNLSAADTLTGCSKRSISSAPHPEPAAPETRCANP